LTAALRASLIAACGLLSLALPAPPGRVAAALGVLSLGAAAAYLSNRTSRTGCWVEAAVVAAAIPWTGGEHSPLLPYLLAPGLVLGMTVGVLDLLLASCLVLVTLAVAGRLVDPSTTMVVAGAEWAGLSLASGLLAVWCRHLVPPDLYAPEAREAEAYRDVRRLLGQLRGLTRRLPAGLDADGAAQDLLARCSRLAGPDRGAVVVETGDGVFVPLSVTGADRVPWRTPMEGSGPLRIAWVTGQPSTDHRAPDIDGRRAGSTLVVVPLLGSEGTFGLVILEASEPHQLALTDGLIDLVTRAAPQLETALLFEELRREATVQERDRLAREMHDGVAQDLAVVGYQLDDLRRRAPGAFEEQVSEVRETVTALIGDLRLRITELRTSVHPERGLGAALSTYLRAVCSGRGIVLTLALRENGFRLPVEQEMALLRVAQLFAQESRRAEEITELRVHLLVEPPSALLTLTCDAGLSGLQRKQVNDVLQHVPAEVLRLTQSHDHTHLEITMKGTEHDERPAGGRPLAYSEGTAAGL
jgi:hypothetical protein